MQLAGGAELVAAVEVEDILDVVADDGVECEVAGCVATGVASPGLRVDGQGKVVGADDAVYGFEEGGFKHGGQLADIAGPVVLEEAGERAGAEDDGALLIAGADAVEQGLGE